MHVSGLQRMSRMQHDFILGEATPALKWRLAASRSRLLRYRAEIGVGENVAERMEICLQELPKIMQCAARPDDCISCNVLWRPELVLQRTLTA